MNAIDWILQELKPGKCTSEEFFYNDMDSQSGYALPIIYEPFDINRRSHWSDRGALFDFLFATRGHGKRLLDFGPGDGWPSLIMAPFVGEIVGVEGSRRRVDVCKANAGRMGISNVDFVFVEPGGPLPFETASFDGAMAASSIEQTPDPCFSLKELHRVLKASGRLRVDYEDLDRYRGSKEQEATILALDDKTCKLVLYDRDITRELAAMYGVTLSIPAGEAAKVLSGEAGTVRFERITPDLLDESRPHIKSAQVCTLMHPSAKTFVGLLDDAGFSEVLPTHSGIRLARDLFDDLVGEDRPCGLDALDSLLKPLVETEVGKPAPAEANPPITAVK
ncbi:MAG: class I SAM-dependent methyltransferase [Candidatus Eisenbacteria bacterium]